LKPFWQTSHTYGRVGCTLSVADDSVFVELPIDFRLPTTLSAACVDRKWYFNCWDCENFLGHRLHWNGFSPLCILKWTFNEDFWIKNLAQCSHWYRLLFLSWSRMCTWYEARWTKSEKRRKWTDTWNEKKTMITFFAMTATVRRS
jgi:hypothetical protein